eukprot:5109633-Amphidinium_carterae.3
MTSDLKTLTGSDCNWYSRKDVDRQFQIKGELSKNTRISMEDYYDNSMGKYMEMKAAYRQKHRRL